MANVIVKVDNLSKVFKEGKERLIALKDIKFSVKAGEFVCIVGPSGSGKSTLMNIIGLLDTPSHGSVTINNETISTRTKINRLAKMRRDNIGFIFQTFNLLPRVSALGNVELPLIYSGRSNRKNKAAELLKLVGLEGRISHKPNELSGGERQRVAIARALSNNPEIILADEPTGNLDSKSGKVVIDLLKKLNQAGKTIIVITHDRDIASEADRQIILKDGKIV